jgi:hypothetical protein
MTEKLNAGADIPFSRIAMTIMLVIFWAGVFSGYYTRHPESRGNLNPDSWIHSGLVVWTGLVAVEWWRVAPRKGRNNE